MNRSRWTRTALGPWGQPGLGRLRTSRALPASLDLVLTWSCTPNILWWISMSTDHRTRVRVDCVTTGRGARVAPADRIKVLICRSARHPSAGTAQRLFTHRHTIYYRLERVRELSGLDVSSSDGREKLSLGLKSMRVLGIASPGGPASEAGAEAGRVPRRSGRRT